MENTFIISIGSALWLGVLTSISPCPLATNIAAVSYIGKNISSKIMSVLAGIFYSLGRMFVYMIISGIVVASLASVPALSMFLQTKINIALGPLLILTGLVVAGIIKLNLAIGADTDKAQKLLKKGPVLGSFFIGSLFALAFCPVSAAIFFGSLVPVAMKHQSVFIIPAVYGFGTAIPVIVFAVLIAAGARYVGAVFNKITQIEIWIRRVTGIIFIGVGIYFTVTYIFGIQLF